MHFLAAKVVDFCAGGISVREKQAFGHCPCVFVQVAPIC